MAYPFRFLTQKSMSSIKHDDAKSDSYYKRTGIERPANTRHVMCGCDFTDPNPNCVFVSDYGKHLEPKPAPVTPKPKKKF